jgi:hypothetical protein
MCCPTSDGAGCAIVCSEAFLRSHGLINQAIEIVAQATTTDSPKLFEDRSAIELAGSDMTRRAAKQVWEASGIKPDDVQVRLFLFFLSFPRGYRCSYRSSSFTTASLPTSLSPTTLSVSLRPEKLTKSSARATERTVESGSSMLVEVYSRRDILWVRPASPS